MIVFLIIIILVLFLILYDNSNIVYNNNFNINKLEQYLINLEDRIDRFEITNNLLNYYDFTNVIKYPAIIGKNIPNEELIKIVKPSAIKSILDNYNCKFLILIPLLNFNSDPILFYDDSRIRIIYFNSNLEYWATDIHCHIEEWNKLQILINKLYNFNIENRNDE